MEPHNVTPATPPAANTVHVKPSQLNYAGAVFFTLLIVGFTLQLPTIITAPMIFFTIAAGVIFFKDLLSGMTIGRKASPDDVFAKPQKGTRRFILRLLFWTLAIAGIAVIAYIGLIILLFVLLSSGGGFG